MEFLTFSVKNSEKGYTDMDEIKEVEKPTIETDWMVAVGFLCKISEHLSKVLNEMSSESRALANIRKLLRGFEFNTSANPGFNSHFDVLFDHIDWGLSDHIDLDEVIAIGDDMYDEPDFVPVYGYIGRLPNAASFLMIPSGHSFSKFERLVVTTPDGSNAIEINSGGGVHFIRRVKTLFEVLWISAKLHK